MRRASFGSWMVRSMASVDGPLPERVTEASRILARICCDGAVHVGRVAERRDESRGRHRVVQRPVRHRPPAAPSAVITADLAPFWPLTRARNSLPLHEARGKKFGAEQHQHDLRRVARGELAGVVRRHAPLSASSRSPAPCAANRARAENARKSPRPNRSSKRRRRNPQPQIDESLISLWHLSSASSRAQAGADGSAATTDCSHRTTRGQTGQQPLQLAIIATRLRQGLLAT